MGHLQASQQDGPEGDSNSLTTLVLYRQDTSDVGGSLPSTTSDTELTANQERSTSSRLTMEQHNPNNDRSDKGSSVMADQPMLMEWTHMDPKEH